MKGGYKPNGSTSSRRKGRKGGKKKKIPVGVKSEKTQEIHTILKDRFSEESSNWYKENKTIHLACKYGFIDDVHDFLMAFPEDLNKLDGDKHTPLYYACYCGHSHIVDLLVGKGCEIPDGGFCAHKRDRDLLVLVKKYSSYELIPREEKMKFNDLQWRAAEEAARKDKKKRKKKENVAVDDQPIFFADLSFSQVLNRVFDEQVKGEHEKIYESTGKEGKEETDGFSMKFFDPDAKKKRVDDVNVHEEEEMKSPVRVLFGDDIFDSAFSPMTMKKKLEEMAEEEEEERVFLSDSSISFELVNRSVQKYHTHLVVLLIRWKYFANTFFKKEDLLQRLSDDSQMELNQVIFEAIQKLKRKRGGFQMKAGKVYTEDCHEMLLKALYTGNVKFFDMLLQGKELFKRFTKEFTVRKEDLQIRLFTSQKIMDREKQKFDDGMENTYFEELIRFHTSDAELLCQDDTLFTHKFILTNRCHFFSLSLLGPFAETNEIQFENESTDSIAELVKFLYSDAVDLNEENVIEIAVLSQKFFLKRLQKKCAKFLKGWIDVSNVVSVYHVSLMFNLTLISPLCIRKMHKFLDDNPFLWLEIRDIFKDFEISTEVLKKTMALRFFVHLDDVKEPTPSDFVKAVMIEEYERAAFIMSREHIKVNPYKALRKGEMTKKLFRFFNSPFYEWDQVKLSDMIIANKIPPEFLKTLFERNATNGFEPGEGFFWNCACKGEMQLLQKIIDPVFTIDHLEALIERFNSRIDEVFDGFLDVPFGDINAYNEKNELLFQSPAFLGLTCIYFSCFSHWLGKCFKGRSRRNGARLLRVALIHFFHSLRNVQEKDISKFVFERYKWKLTRLFFRILIHKTLNLCETLKEVKSKIINRVLTDYFPREYPFRMRGKFHFVFAFLHLDLPVQVSQGKRVVGEGMKFFRGDDQTKIQSFKKTASALVVSDDWKIMWSRYYVHISENEVIKEKFIV